MSGDGKGSGARRPRPIGRPQALPGPLGDLKVLLYELYLEAGLPTLDQIATAVAQDDQLAGAPGRDTIARIIGGRGMPASQADVVAVATVLARAARWDPGDAAVRARDLWVAARMDPVRSLAPGVRVREASPRLLGVHAAISEPGVPDEALPEYVPRDIDSAEFGVRVRVTAAAQRGGFLLLVGGSSVGKTRSAYEVVRALLPDWWLVHPAGPAEVAALAQAPPSRTVVWLDELQRFLDGEHGLTGGAVQALLKAPDPVLIIGTIWPDLYTAYAVPPVAGGDDPHARERQVLDLADVVRVAPQFSPAEQDRARAAAARDRRLAIALGTTGYGLTQSLAAAPQLVARWEDAQAAAPYAWAVLTAAVDAARLGARAPLSIGFLRAAAPGYCTRRQQAEAPEKWLEQALAYATRKLHGAAAALSPAGADMGEIAGYTPADYLIQHASRERRYERLPTSTWEAIVSHLRDPADTMQLASSARARLLYCYAIPLYQHVVDAEGQHAADAECGCGDAAGPLAELLAKRGDLDKAIQILRARPGFYRGASGMLAGLLAESGDLDGLRAKADAGGHDARVKLAGLLADRGDLDELRTRANAGDPLADWRLAGMLARRGDLDELRARADAGNYYSTEMLADVLASRGDLDELRARADAGDYHCTGWLPDMLARRGDLDEAIRILRGRESWPAAMRLADYLAERGNLLEATQASDIAIRILRTEADAGSQYDAGQLAEALAERGDLDELRARAQAGDWPAARRLAKHLAERGDLDEAEQIRDRGIRALRAQIDQWRALAECRDLGEALARANALDPFASMRLAEALAEHGDLDELRARADAGDLYANRLLAGALAEHGDLDELRARADAGNRPAARLLGEALAERGDWDELRARVDAGDGSAAEPLIELLTRRGQGEEAERLRRFGLNPDGSIARA